MKFNIFICTQNFRLSPAKCPRGRKRVHGYVSRRTSVKCNIFAACTWTNLGRLIEHIMYKYYVQCNLLLNAIIKINWTILNI